MWKRGKSSFPHYFIYIFLTSGVKLHIYLLNVVIQFIVFLPLSTLICRSTDISKCFSEALEFEITRVDYKLFLISHIIWLKAVTGAFFIYPYLLGNFSSL